MEIASTNHMILLRLKQIIKNLPIIGDLVKSVAGLIRIIFHYLGYPLTPANERADPSEEVWENNPWQNVFKRRSEAAKQYSAGKECIDICCGTGWITYEISTVAKKVVGVDRSQKAISMAKAKYDNPNTEYHEADALDIPFDDASFDVTVLMEAIEHFTKQDGERLIDQAYRLLRNGGVLVGSTPAVNNRNPINLWLLKLSDPYHLYLYSERLLLRVLKTRFDDVSISSQPEGWFLFVCRK